MAATDEELRHDVALANRIIERFGLSNAFGHASARIPGLPVTHLLNVAIIKKTA